MRDAIRDALTVTCPGCGLRSRVALAGQRRVLVRCPNIEFMGWTRTPQGAVVPHLAYQMYVPTDGRGWWVERYQPDAAEGGYDGVPRWTCNTWYWIRVPAPPPGQQAGAT